MTTSQSHHAARPRLSRPLLALFAAFFAAGLVQGGFVYANRSPAPEKHLAGTAAWWPHLALALFAVALAAGVFVHRRRNGRRGTALLLPVGERAARRVRRTLANASRGRGLWRIVAAIIPAAVLLYGAFRAGVQVTGGLDPDFTVNAWGGPTYAGAMACHYLDALLMMAAAAWLLDKILLRQDSYFGTDRSA
ncbi:hypothetical protein L5G28_00490 [Gordonia sp. HY285]|uniref:hypothetical protein n=1 Tax=Gordonia liuliyuniae TaxID=2911517 RepID=UPI001F41805C|nr:hypothetical protein [Gordonia liuliyuniae]MCF8608646.1 hypothetical protein [Gordonia liuliyuniae]